MLALLLLLAGADPSVQSWERNQWERGRFGFDRPIWDAGRYGVIAPRLEQGAGGGYADSVAVGAAGAFNGGSGRSAAAETPRPAFPVMAPARLPPAPRLGLPVLPPDAGYLPDR